MRIGIQEKKAPAEYKVYEHGIAVADVTIGWIYGIAGIALILGAKWGFKLSWLPGVVLIYQSLFFLFWSKNQRNSGHRLMTDSMRIGRFFANGLTGILTILIAWNNC